MIDIETFLSAALVGAIIIFILSMISIGLMVARLDTGPYTKEKSDD